MRVFVLGKPREITRWTEHCVLGFQAGGHDVALGVTRDPALHPGIERLLMARWTGARPVRRLLAAITAFRPDLILGVRAFAIPPPILRAVAALPARAPFLGWVGDLFGPQDAAAATCFDALAYTDTYMLSRHHALGFSTPAAYVPHAASPTMPPTTTERRSMLAFVANPTPHRRALIGTIDEPLALFGPGWSGARHVIEARRIGAEELGRIYAGHLGVLNIRHEDNVVNGLNQRHFDPYQHATPVLTDAQADLGLCLEPGREVLVYRDAAELVDIYRRMRAEPDWAAAIGEAGRRRVLAEHLYQHRLAALASLV
jgi:spore maturation protein CgeB